MKLETILKMIPEDDPQAEPQAEPQDDPQAEPQDDPQYKYQMMHPPETLFVQKWVSQGGYTLIERYSVSHFSIQTVTFALRFQRLTEKKINSQELVGQKRLGRRSLNAKVFVVSWF